MKAYHGSNKIFDRFDLTHQGEGEGSDLIVPGVYCATSISVADDYRQKVIIPGSEHTDHCYFSDDICLSGDTLRIARLLEIRDNENAPEAMRDKARDELDDMGARDPVLMAGAVYETTIPDREHLLRWEGDINDQPFDVVEFLRDWYGDDEVEELYEEAMEESGSCTISYFDEVFEQALLRGVDDMRNELREISPDFDWDRLASLMGDKCPDLQPDECEVGRALYDILRHVEGGDEGAVKRLAEHGVHGVLSQPNFAGLQGKEEVVVIFKESDVRINGMLSPGEIEMARSKDQDKQQDYRPGMSLDY